MVMRGQFAGSKFSRRVAKEKREVAEFTGNLSRLRELASQIPDEVALDHILSQQPDMDPEVKAECRKLILKFMVDPDAEPDELPAEQAEP